MEDRMKKNIIILLLGVLLTSCGQTIDTETMVAWESPHGSIYNNGSSMNLPTPPLKVSWEFSLKDITHCEPVAGGGAVLLSDEKGLIYCLGETDGLLIWSRQFGAGITIQPVISKGRVFLGDGGSQLFSIDIGSGSVLWTKELDSPIVGWPIVDTGRVWVCSSNSLYCFEETAGTEIFSIKSPKNFTSAPSLQRYLYLVAGNSLQAVIPESGVLVWRRDFKNKIVGTVTCLSSGIIVCDGELHILSDSKGELLSDYKEEEGYLFTSSASIYVNLVVACNNKPEVVCFTKSPLQRLWSLAPIKLSNVAPVIGEKYVYFVSNDGRLYCCKASDGQWQWHHQMGSKVVGLCPLEDHIVIVSELGLVKRLDIGGKPMTKDEMIK